jgi:dTDP-L-rhamnose 4-epimerase
MNVLVTGGAGFIGSFLVDTLIERGHSVRILDNLEDQVHRGKKPDYLNADAEFIEGDVRSIDTLSKAVHGIDTVCHMASAVGVAQSMYEIKRYSDVNVGGIANLLDCIAKKKHTIKKILLPSSMTAYGEGAYQCDDHGTVRPGLRPLAQLQKRDWELRCPICHAVVTPVATPETADRQSGTVYSLTKNLQEDMLLSVARTYGIGATAFRLFNVYGPRQSLSNPYTGVSAIFLSRLKNNETPIVFEDGLQSRDFVSVHDVIDACMLALETDKVNNATINIGSGVPTSIKDIAVTLASLLGKNIQPVLTGDFRQNDVRHCFADRTRAKELLGWEPRVSFSEGMRELIEWSTDQKAEDLFDKAKEELRSQKILSSSSHA